jgi:putative holliday junction resolvase
MKLIGVDYGRRRIGLAVTDENGEFIRSLPTLHRKSNTSYLYELVEIIQKENPSQIVVGLPLNADDQDTTMSLEIRAFADKLRRMASLPVHFIDESLTSKRALDIILHHKKKRRQNKENTDRIAACLILEAFQKEKR